MILSATLVVSSAVLGIVDQTKMNVAGVRIQDAVMQLILLVVTEIITKKGVVKLIAIKTEVVEIVTEIDTGPMTGIAMIVTAEITKIVIGTVMIVIGKIGILTIMVIKIMEDPVTETMKEIGIVIAIAIEAMIEIVTGITTTKTEQDIPAESGIERGAMATIVMKLYTHSLFL